MSSANVELVRSVYEAWNRQDLDAALEPFDPDAEWRMPPNFPESGTLRGLGAIREGAASLLDLFGRFEADVEELIDAGDRVVALVRYRGEARTPGLEVAGSAVDGSVWTLREGKVVSVVMHAGTEAALEAADLAPKDP